LYAAESLAPLKPDKKAKNVMKEFGHKSEPNPAVVAAVNEVARNQGGTERTARTLGPDKMVGGEGVGGIYSTEGRYDGSDMDPPPRSLASGDTFFNPEFPVHMDW
jgi:hypothetical protein